MATLDAPDTVVPTVQFDTLRITKDQKEGRPAYVTHPKVRKYHEPLNEYAALFDEAPRIMALDEVRRGPNPAYVPFAMNRVIGDDEPKWEKPKETRKFNIDVSHAEVVEQRVPPPPPLFDGPPSTKLLAYDDMDPYASRTRRLRNVEELESDRVRVGHAQVYQLGNVVCVFNADMSAVWVLDTTILSNSSGWRRYPCLGQAPPIGSLLLPNSADSTFTAVVAPEWFVLELLPGEPDTKWVRCKLKGDWTTFTVTWSQVIENDTFYIRSDNNHAMVTPMVKSAKRKGHGTTFLHSIAKAVISPHEELCAISNIRSTPVKENLTPVEGMPGVAIDRCLEHIWIFVFTPRARNYLPIKRIDVVAPLSVRMPRGLYFFSHPPKRMGSIAKRCLQATHRVKPPTFDPRTGMPDINCEDATKDGEVTLSISPDVVAVLGPMNDNCVIVLAKDLENYVVVELDRFEKLKRFAGVNPDLKRDGSSKYGPQSSQGQTIVGTSGNDGDAELNPGQGKNIRQKQTHSLGTANLQMEGSVLDQTARRTPSRHAGGGAGGSGLSSPVAPSPLPSEGGGDTPPPPPLPPGEEHYFNSHSIDATKALWK